MRRFFVILLLKGILCDEFFSSSLSMADQCANICQESELPPIYLSNALKKEQIICQRGCRFFNIIKFKDELNINTTKKECYLSCEESYISKKENEICKTGCNLMVEKRQNEMASFLILTEDDSSNSIVLAEPDIEILESDTLSDPSIKSQLEIGFNIDYKIPETHIRTMPITQREKMLILKTSGYTGDWLDCASRNSGIPRWILLTAILSAVLLALWLSFSSDKKSSAEEECIADIDMPDEKLIIANEELSDIEKDPALFVENEVNFSKPPKYEMENEHV